jgi:hypothetical protein
MVTARNSFFDKIESPFLKSYEQVHPENTVDDAHGVYLN